MIGFAMCGSYCTHKYAIAELEKLVASGYEVLPILSENVYSTDTRFGRAEELMASTGESRLETAFISIVRRYER